MQNWHTEKIDHLRFRRQNRKNKPVKGCFIIEAIWNAEIIRVNTLINAEANETKGNTSTKYGVIEEGKEIGDDEVAVVIEKGNEIGDDEVGKE